MWPGRRSGCSGGRPRTAGRSAARFKRVYVPAALYEPMVGHLAELAQGVTVGNGLDENSQLGPVNNQPQFERVQELVEDARQCGARVATGGQRVGDRGYFYAPTIVADLVDGARLVDEEQFGPVLPVVSYTDVEDAIARANATHFGLSGSIWSSDPVRAEEVARRLECGTACGQPTPERVTSCAVSAAPSGLVSGWRTVPGDCSVSPKSRL